MSPWLGPETRDINSKFDTSPNRRLFLLLPKLERELGPDPPLIETIVDGTSLMAVELSATRYDASFQLYDGSFQLVNN